MEGYLKPYRDFNPWFDKYKEYGFVEDEDYRLVSIKILTNNPKNPESEAKDYEITLDMAKQLAMLQKSEKGQQYRQYFIELEKKWNSPEYVMKRALEMANKKCIELDIKLAEAIKTKALISDKKVATALGKVGGLTKEVNRLKEKVGEIEGYATIMAIENEHHIKCNWRLLKTYCDNHKLPIKEVPDVRYGKVKSYPTEAFKTLYNI